MRGILRRVWRSLSYRSPASRTGSAAASRFSPLRSADYGLATDPGAGTQTAIFEEALNTLRQGIVLFDEKRRIVYCNAQYRQIYALAPEQVAPGTPIAHLIRRRLELGLQVPSAAEDYVRERLSGPVIASSATHKFADGRTIAYSVHPMPDGGGMATHEDVTQREELQASLDRQHQHSKSQEDQLLVRNLQFDMAINNMSQGLCFFDGAQRLIVCNSRYTEMYGLAPESIYPGMTLREIIDLRFEAGSFPAMSREEYHAWRNDISISPQSSDSVVELKNGRIIEIHHRPMPDGGWVATHEDITDRRAAEAKIAHMALHDALTGLSNRVYFRQQIETRLRHLDREQQFAVLCLDLDRFKAVNDTLGHSLGDMLLRQVGDRLSKCLREGDVIARLGGDEFAILQGGVTQPTDTTSLAARLVQVIGMPFDLEGHQVVIGLSIGIALAPADAKEPDQLLRNADLALYRAKADGRGTYRFFEPDMDALMQARRTLELDLRRALVNNELELYYQPIVNLELREISAFEALLRWNHPTRGLISPMDFIPLAEETELMVPIGEWVLRQACREAAKWPDSIKIAVNLSATQFKMRNLTQVVMNALATSGLAAGRLELEITESVLLFNSESTLSILHQLRAIGVHIAMDDFGTGYSSLSYLRSFPFDKIKIDRSFVHELASNQDSMAIIRAVTSLGASLGMATTGEGVETQEELDYLRREGCTEAQGYLFSRPRPAAELAKMLADHTGHIKAVA